jgi:hypothetical protein
MLSTYDEPKDDSRPSSSPEVHFSGRGPSLLLKPVGSAGFVSFQQLRHSVKVREVIRRYEISAHAIEIAARDQGIRA